MEPERPEVYERIPWETLEKSGRDRQWIVYLVTGSIALGALAYSFMRNQPTAPPPPVAAPTSTVPATTNPSNIGSTPGHVDSPVVVAEADLFAVDPERLLDQAVSHAEWFAVEFMSVDGTDLSRQQLAALLPGGVPLPEAPEGTQVFVDWAGAMAATETSPGRFQVDVLVRSLLSRGSEGFERQPPVVVGVLIEVGEEAQPRVTEAPSVEAVALPAPSDAALGPVPEEVSTALASTYQRVVGGTERPDGGWDVVVMATGADGVIRPVTVPSR
ncbi:MAG TPA: hypothetical protein VJ858_05090 [Acidimicrobiia bacterium]|nr:hypothetical protein [Acidimicrobiia bacterium]